MPENKEISIIQNDWAVLRKYTDARIALGRAGNSLPSNELLSFQLAHAKAQDAVYLPLDMAALMSELKAVSHKPAIVLNTQAESRTHYLQRPDLGKRLAPNSVELLNLEMKKSPISSDLAIVIVDGLSSLAIQKNAVIFLQHLIEALENSDENWSLAPLTIVKEGRVAIGDEVAQTLNAKVVLVLIGERPGLSSPGSMGLYLTWEPTIGLSDSRRNCISNIHSAGLSYAEAVEKTLYLLTEARRIKISGVALKDKTSDHPLENVLETTFLINLGIET